MKLTLHVRRFRCLNAACEQKTFAERLPEVVASAARRTIRLKVFAIHTAGEPGTRLLAHTGVGTEHLLLAIMSEGEGIAVKALAQFQVQEDEIRKQIETAHPVGEQPVGEGQIGMTAQGKQSIELAVQEARALGHHYIGTEHLLLGLLREEEGLANQVLLQSGVTLEEARELVKQLLTSEHTTRASVPEHGKKERPDE